MPSMMKQNFKNTVKQLMIVPSIILGLLCVVSVATAQNSTTTPKKLLPDIMLNKHNAGEVIQRALADWGSEMLAANPTSTEYVKLSARYAFLYNLNAMLEIKEKLNVSNCIDEAARFVISENLITTNETVYNEVMVEIRTLLLKKNNPGYKE
jgi:hypothetical protein